MDTPTCLATSTLVLRRLNLADASTLRAAYLAAGDVVGMESCATVEDAAVAIAAFELDARRGARLVYGVCDRATGALHGLASLMATPTGAAQIGIWLTASTRGAGVGRAAVAALCEVAARWLRPSALELCCDAENAPMIRVAERLGFTRTATVPGWSPRPDGTHADLVIWRARPEATATLEVVASSIPDLRACLWTAASVHLTATRSVRAEAPLACELAIEVVLPSGSCSQIVVVELGTAGGRPWLMLRAPVGREDMLEVTDTLRHNATLAIGALALAAGGHELRYGMFAESTSVAALDGAIDLLAHEAARLRMLGRSSAASHAAAFAAYAD